MDEIIIVDNPIPKEKLKPIAEKRFGDMIKAVVDLEKNIMAIGGGMHADEESILLEKGSKQENLWGINIYPEYPPKTMVEFDSMINIRPRQNNRSRGVENENIRKEILKIVTKLII